MKKFYFFGPILLLNYKIAAQDNNSFNNTVLNNERFLNKNEEFTVKDQITIHAEPAEVWKALTDPEITKKYFYGCKVYSEWKPGNEISFRRKFLWKKIELKGKILNIEPQKLLQYTLSNSKHNGTESQSLVTDKLSFANGETTVFITDNVGSGAGAEKRFKRSVKGWRKILKGLKKVCETTG
jgi:uncharacterized protein YndB with AHSA1/START domain